MLCCYAVEQKHSLPHIIKPFLRWDASSQCSCSCFSTSNTSGIEFRNFWNPGLELCSFLGVLPPKCSCGVRLQWKIEVNNNPTESREMSLYLGEQFLGFAIPSSVLGKPNQCFKIDLSQTKEQNKTQNLLLQIHLPLIPSLDILINIPKCLKINERNHALLK